MKEPIPPELPGIIASEIKNTTRRDPARIDRVVEKLRVAWKKNPDWRLGQLLVNIAPASEKKLFFIEDDAIETAISGIIAEEERDAAEQAAKFATDRLRMAGTVAWIKKHPIDHEKEEAWLEIKSDGTWLTIVSHEFVDSPIICGQFPIVADQREQS
jgi:uncharacterized protein YihD (DUF1040 family)